jgi:protein-disulfide isomerase
MRGMRALVSGFLLLMAAMGQTAPALKKSFLDKATLEAYVRHLFVWPTQITVKVSDPRPSKVDGLLEITVTGSMGNASQSSHFFVSRDGQSVVQGTAFAVSENPFKSNIDRIKTAFAPGVGTSGAPVVVVMYSDFQCPHCKEEAQMIRANLLQTFSKEVRLYFKDFPLEPIHDWAKTAAMAGRCVWREDQERFWDYHDWVFGKQESIGAATFRKQFEGFLTEKKIASAPVLKCLDERATEADVKASFEEGQTVAVTSTPTLFVNGRRLAGKLSWPQLKQIIEFEIEYQKTAKNAGENCGCELTLPSVLPQ